MPTIRSDCFMAAAAGSSDSKRRTRSKNHSGVQMNYCPTRNLSCKTSAGGGGDIDYRPRCTFYTRTIRTGGVESGTRSVYIRNSPFGPNYIYYIIVPVAKKKIIIKNEREIIFKIANGGVGLDAIDFFFPPNVML